MWLFLIEVGFVGFIVSLFGAVWRGFDRAGRVPPERRRGLALWLLAAALFFLTWAVALSRFPAPRPQ